MLKKLISQSKNCFGQFLKLEWIWQRWLVTPLF